MDRTFPGMMAVILLALGGQAYLGGLARQSDPAFVVPPVSSQHRWDPRLFRMLSFGNLPVVVDALLIRFLGSDPSYNHVAKGRHTQGYFDLDVATELDPAFLALYLSGANYLAIIRNDVVGASRLLEKGNRFRKEELASYPVGFREREWASSWQIPVLQGYIALFELGDIPAAARAFKEAAEAPSAHQYIKNLAQTLEREDGAFKVGDWILSTMLANAKTDEEKEALSRKRVSLGLQRFVHDVNRRFAGFSAGARDGSRNASARWEAFLRGTRTAPMDPLGGKLYVDEHGRVATTTPYDRVMGLP